MKNKCSKVLDTAIEVAGTGFGLVLICILSAITIVAEVFSWVARKCSKISHKAYKHCRRKQWGTIPRNRRDD